MWSAYHDATPWDVTKWTIKDKVNKDLLANPYDGTGPKYRDWSANVINHLLSSNQGWGKVMWMVQREREPLTYQRLATTNYEDTGLQLDWVWIARPPYTFLFNHVTQGRKRGLPRKVGQGEELNGLELWRKLYVDNEGGYAEVEVQDRDACIKCPTLP